MQIEQSEFTGTRKLPMRSKYKAILELKPGECAVVGRKEYAAVYHFAAYHGVSIKVRTHDADTTKLRVWKV